MLAGVTGGTGAGVGILAVCAAAAMSGVVLRSASEMALSVDISPLADRCESTSTVYFAEASNTETPWQTNSRELTSCSIAVAQFGLLCIAFLMLTS